MVKIQEYCNEIKLILYCVRNNKDYRKQDEIKQLLSQPLNWKFIIKESVYHSVISFIYRELSKANLNVKIPQDFLSQLEHCYYKILFKNCLLWEEFCRIYDSLTQAKIEIIPIKGIILAGTLYHHDLGLRPMVDIDILIQRSDLLAAEEKFSQLGYRKNTKEYSQEYYERYNCHLPFERINSNRRFICELHWNLAVPRPNTVVLFNLWQNAKEQIVDGKTILMLSPEDTLFSLALHLRRYNQPLSLRYICDIHNLLRINRDNFNWDYVINESNVNRTKSTLYFALFSAHKIFDAPIPAYVLNKLNPGLIRSRLMQFLLSRYTFSLNLVSESKKGAYLYMFLRFLLYDKAWDFISFILFIPIEEFARFYSLDVDSKKTVLIYRFKIIYILCHSSLHLAKIIMNTLKSFFKR